MTAHQLGTGARLALVDAQLGHDLLARRATGPSPSAHTAFTYRKAVGRGGPRRPRPLGLKLQRRHELSEKGVSYLLTRSEP